MFRTLSMMLLACVFGFGVAVGCEESSDSPAERVGEAVEDAAEETKDAAEEVGEKAEEAAEETKEAAEDAMN